MARIRCGRMLSRGRCRLILGNVALGMDGPVSHLDVLPVGLESHPDLDVLPAGSTRPHIEALDQRSGRLVVRCACEAEHVIKSRAVMDAFWAKLQADPTLRRVDILTSEL